VYAIEEHRQVGVAISVLGLGFAGVLVRDGYAPYRRFVEARHQICVAHYADVGIMPTFCAAATSCWRSPGGREIPHLVRRLLLDALAVRTRREEMVIDAVSVRREATELEARLDRLLDSTSI
jgi:hypothetical protein